MQEQVYIVMLRRPRKNDLLDKRSDPFWEFGSFGLTGCHSRNLLHLKRLDDIRQARLAFVQGSEFFIRLIMLTPPVEVKKHKKYNEAKWWPIEMPFYFLSAPLIIDNCGYTHFPKIKRLVRAVNRTTWMGKFSSAFRARTKPLPASAAEELIKVYEHFRTNNYQLIEYYTEAMPFVPGVVDRNRKKTYTKLLQQAKK